ncbi:MAG: anthranilate phosphoribosyltransferase [Turneriella sp.]
MIYSALLEKLLAQQNLPAEEITWLIAETMHGRLTPAQVAGWLIALRNKGETPEEVASCARTLRSMATPIRRDELPPLFIDTCGTGGDRSHLINISTLVGLTLAALGIPVAKHGNRAVSSASGSADVLEACGYPLEENPELITARLAARNFAFFFAPLYHPAMKHAGPVRKELGVRTIFNILGPLANPAGAPVQLMGVYDSALLAPVAETLRLLGVRAALVVHSEDGLDEISPIAKTRYVLLQRSGISHGVYSPPAQEHLRSLEAVKATTKEASLAMFRAVVAGELPAGAYMTALNAAFARRLFQSVQAGQELKDPAPSVDEIAEIMSLIQNGALQRILAFA